MQHQISLPPKHSEILTKEADRLGISKSEVIRRALELQEAARDREVNQK